MHPELCLGGGASTVTLSTSDAAAVFVHTFSVALPVAVLLTKSCVMALVLACVVVRMQWTWLVAMPLSMM